MKRKENCFEKAVLFLYRREEFVALTYKSIDFSMIEQSGFS